MNIICSGIQRRNDAYSTFMVITLARFSLIERLNLVVRVGLELPEPSRNRTKLKQCCLTNELRLRRDIDLRAKIPHMARSIDQVLRMLVRPVSLRRKSRMVTQIPPRICRSIDVQQPVCRNICTAVDIPSFKIGRLGYFVVFPCVHMSNSMSIRRIY